MKAFFKIAVLGMAIAVLAGCEKDENQIFYESGTEPVLSASTTTPDLKPQPTFDKDPVMTFNWTNPEYQFTTGISSHNVNYRIEFDTVGSNFTNPDKGVVVVAKDLTKTFTTGEMNAMLSGLNQMKLTPDREYNMEARVVSYIGTGAAPLISNKISFKVKPFSPPPAVDPPTTGRLFLIGSASPGGWPNPVPANQEFTKVSNTLYEITIALTGGNSLLFLPVNGSWDVKYGFKGSNNANQPNGDNLEKGGGDIKVPAADGTYKVVVNFQTGKFSITKQ